MSSALGEALGMSSTYTWTQVVSAITGVVNRGTLNWSGSNTTYVLSSGYYIGGTLDSRPSYTNGYNTGVSAADNRVNTSSASYSSGYNNGYSAGNSAGYNNGYNAGVAAYRMTYANLRFSGKSKEFATVGTYTATRTGPHLFVFNKSCQAQPNDMDGQALLNGAVISSFEGASYSGSSSGNTYSWKFAVSLTSGSVVTFQLRNHYSKSYTTIIDGAVAF